MGPGERSPATPRAAWALSPLGRRVPWVSIPSPPLLPAPTSLTPARLWGFAISVPAGASAGPARWRPVAVALPLPQRAADQGKYFCGCIRVFLARAFPVHLWGFPPRPPSVPSPAATGTLPCSPPHTHTPLGIVTSGLPEALRAPRCPRWVVPHATAGSPHVSPCPGRP